MIKNSFTNKFFKKIFNQTDQIQINKEKKFSTFEGVYRPTILTILGMMMYLREGWVVGNVGIFNTLFIIAFAFIITGTAAFSLSSIITNMKIGSGGVFSIVSNTLGLEIGGSIGIPLYLAQTLSAAMYVFGFSEIWQMIFPEHPVLLVSLGAFAVLFLLSFIGAELAFKVQLFIFVIVIAALVSILGGFFFVEDNDFFLSNIIWERLNSLKSNLWKNENAKSIWFYFAIFFPAATGIKIGSSMSGNLKNPTKSIPKGTIAAWLTAFIVYSSLAIWYGSIGSSNELIQQNDIVLKKSLFTPIVMIAMLTSSFSAALSSLISAPRILQSLSIYQITPKSNFFKKIKKNGEPRNAVFFTSLIILTILLIFRNLNSVAPFITQFYLIIYLILNVVLLIEQNLDLISFRPTFIVPRIIPIIGSLSALFAMMVINTFVGFLSIGFIIFLYTYIYSKKLKTPWEIVNSGLFISFIKWLAKIFSNHLNKENKRLWEPNLLLFIENKKGSQFLQEIIFNVVNNQGSIYLLILQKNNKKNINRENIYKMRRFFQRKKIFTHLAEISSINLTTDIENSISIMRNLIFRPNLLFFEIEKKTKQEIAEIINISRQKKISMMFTLINLKTLYLNEKNRSVNLWISDQSPSWQLSFTMANIDITVLIAYQIMKNWRAKLRIISVIKNEKNISVATEYIDNLVEVCRIKNNTEIIVRHGNFYQEISKIDSANVNLFGMPKNFDKELANKIKRKVKDSCFFIQGSGSESAIV